MVAKADFTNTCSYIYISNDPAKLQPLISVGDKKRQSNYFGYESA